MTEVRGTEMPDGTVVSTLVDVSEAHAAVERIKTSELRLALALRATRLGLWEVDLRSNDPRAQLYLGKVISLTARTPQDRQEAEDHFLKAIQYDGTRGAYPDPHLEHALHLIGENGDKNEIKNEIEAYVALYQREHMGTLPNNMAILYDYLTLVGDTNWYAAPAAVAERHVQRHAECVVRHLPGGGELQPAQVRGH